MSSLETFGFLPNFSVEVDPEFPGDGDWRCPVVGFDRDGSIMSEFDSPWGTPLIVRVEPSSGPGWIGMFAAGGLGSQRGVFATPAPDLLAVVVDGLAYLVDSSSPGEHAQTVHDQVHQVVPSEVPPLLLLVRFSDLVAVGRTGVAWRTPRLCVDDLEVWHAGPGGIVCSCDNLRGTPTITLDPTTGLQVEGSRLDSFWPPDTLA